MKPQALHFFSIRFEEGPTIHVACQALSSSKILLEVIFAVSLWHSKKILKAKDTESEKHAINICTYDSVYEIL